MLDNKRINQIKNRIKKYISEGIIITKEKSEFTDFFLTHSKNFLNSAKAEYILSTNNEASKKLGFLDYNGFIVVVNSSYYSMFHMARALLEKEGITIKTEISIHAVTFDAIVYFFYLTQKLEKRLIESFEIARTESTEIQGKERATEIIHDLFYEKRKRSTFTYRMGSELVQAKAKTSLDRATKFHSQLKELIDYKK